LTARRWLARVGSRCRGIHFSGTTASGVFLPDTTHPAFVRRHGFRSTYGLLQPSETKTVISSSNGAVSAGFHILAFSFYTAASAITNITRSGIVCCKATAAHDSRPAHRSSQGCQASGIVLASHMTVRPVRRTQPLRRESHKAGPAVLDDCGAVLVGVPADRPVAA
jgi:hypothetical protein